MRRWAVRGAVLLALAVAPACAAHRPVAVAAAPEAPPTPSEAERLAADLGGLMWPLPLDGARGLTSAYGMRGERHHNGVDLRSRHGDPIFAARDGVVRFSGSMRGYGETVVVDHGNGVTTLYAHAAERYVHAGERVLRGQVIATVGATGNATGPHLHFEVSWAGRPVDPVLLLPHLAAR